MSIPITIDLRQVARGLDTPLRQVQAAVELLDEGNTVPFITRYRKDQTGGLDEEQIREIQDRLNKLRLLADRKQTILRSIESQGKLTEELTEQILAATTSKRLEDLYLPFKPKKMSLAALARGRGLEPLALEILEAAESCLDLDRRAAEFISVDRQVPTAADALLGAGHIIAERFSEQAELRGRLREILQRTGALVSSLIPGEDKTSVAPTDEKAKSDKTDRASEPPYTGHQPTAGAATSSESIDAVVSPFVPAEESHSANTVEAPTAAAEEPSAAFDEPSVVPLADGMVAIAVGVPTEAIAMEIAAAPAHGMASVGLGAVASKPLTAAERKAARKKAKEELRKKRELKRKKLEEKKINSFRDYFDYREAIRKIPPHRVLAINRGERAKVLRVRVEADLQAMVNALEEAVVPPGHPHADYLRGCARDALSRLILPSLEREIRRELTEKAETHAVGVFARNLRNLLLQPPVHNHRLLAVDPGFRSGCKLAALDEFGNMLDHGVIYLVGKPDRLEEARQLVRDLVARHRLTLIAIGNGTACRQTEEFFANLIETEYKDQGLAYAIVNEAGASVYSTSPLGREELPDQDAVLRGAISIGRRLQDPLSELVKIDPANIGVGLYQHDVKAKHLRASLDEVVESCVNFVGVDVNSASPALLRYVSGLNQLTARRLYEYRREHGPFRSRAQFRDVPGFGEAAFVQAAGFLKIIGGDNTLDATWIHPESYEVANKAVERLGGGPVNLADKDAIAALAEPIAKADVAALAAELGVGQLTLRDILAQLVRPGRDPREDLPQPIFKRGVIKIEDLEPGMELTGSVLNVVDFGCFVDIGLHQCGLVHVSRMADRFIRDPHEVAAVGDIVRVWVLGVDKQRQRVSLTMVRPGSERQKPSRRGGRPQKPASTDGQLEQSPPREGQGRRRQGGRPPQHAAGGGQKQSSGQGPQHNRAQKKPEGPGHGGRPPRREQRPAAYRPRPAPKPMIPITEAMKTGKEPLRTFGDLLQFYQQKTTAPSDGQPSPPTKPVVDQPPPAVEPPPVAEVAAEQTPRPVEPSPPVAEAPAIAPPAASGGMERSQ